jgi:hypothetical protein
VRREVDKTALDQRFDRIEDAIAAMRSEFRAEFRDLRGEFQDLRGEFSGLRGEFSGLRGEFSGLQSRLIQIGFGLVGVLITALVAVSLVAFG